MYRAANGAPKSQIPAERRGRLIGRFCSSCYAVFSLHSFRHSGKGLYSKDHISPCPHEGEAFEAGDGWWEPAVEVLPAPAEEASETAA